MSPAWLNFRPCSARPRLPARQSAARLRCTLLAALVCSLLIAGGLAARPVSGEPPLVTAASPVEQQQREWFTRAEEALAEGELDRYRELKARLQDYPLYPYLEFQEVQKRFHTVSRQEIDQLLSQYAEVPRAKLVHQRWVHELGRRQDWAGVLREMPQPAPGNELRCLELRARLEVRGSDAIRDDMPSLWLTGHSLPDSCDPVLKAWREEGGLTADLLWQRASLAIKAGNSGLVRYLKRYMDPDLKAAITTLEQVHHQPSRLDDKASVSPDHPRATAIISHGMVQYSRYEPEKAASLWPHYRDRFPFTPSQLAAVHRSLGLMLAVRYLPQASELLAEARASDDDPNLYEWQARVHLRQGDWQAVAKTIGTFPEDLRNSARWQYWLARAEQQLGQHDQAQARFATTADERNYYGFLAADRLGVPYRLNHRHFSYDPSEFDQIRSRPALARARELFALGYLRSAREEWNSLLDQLEGREVLVASQLARSWGWHEQGVRGAIVTRQWDHLQMRFPLAHQELFDQQARGRGLDVNWVLALARRESSFMTDARSSAGALGLLQLMPGTARQVAREHNLPLESTEQLLDPVRNIQLGTAHLAGLLERFDQNRILATAAYNAGAHRVDEWLKDGGDRLETDVWIETLPYHETRQYVQSVMAYSVIYSFRRGELRDEMMSERELACLCPGDLD